MAKCERYQYLGGAPINNKCTHVAFEFYLPRGLVVNMCFHHAGITCTEQLRDINSRMMRTLTEEVK